MQVSFRKIVLASVAAVGLAVPAMAEVKVGVIDYARLLEESPQAKQVQEALRSEFGPRYQQLVTQEQALKAKGEKLQKDVATMTPEQRTKAEKDLRDSARELERKKQEWQDEAQERWGNTDAWKQCAERAKKYTKADWERMKQEMGTVYGRLEAAFRAGKKPDSPEAIAAVDGIRLLIDKWHYTCSKEFHANLTAMTSSDERFVRNIDKNCPGLAAYMHEAAQANHAVG